MGVRVERDGPVTTVVLDRPEVRNAVDRATAERLTAAFAAFEDDDTASVAVLWGAGGTFCAGADLRAIADGEPNRVEPDGPGPMGPTRMALRKPVIAAVATGAARSAAEALAAQLAALPQDCLRNDRLAVYEGLGRPIDEALAVEYRHGVSSLAGARHGAIAFKERNV
jgi:enoyl-CoA hydratase